MSWAESNWIVNKIKYVWTDTRAGYIDLLANSTYGLKALNNKSSIKSVQRGIITISEDATVGTATISSVNTSKAVVIFGGSIYSSDGSNSARWDARLVLKSDTKVEATRAPGSSYTASVPYQVLEFA